jgi:hypothetical protein
MTKVIGENKKKKVRLKEEREKAEEERRNPIRLREKK